jgi:hypothetical protein
LFALSLPSLAAELVRVVARLVFATMTAIVMVTDVDSAVVCVFVFVVDPDACVI